MSDETFSYVKVKGEYDFPGQDARIVSIPPQQRTLAPATAQQFPIYLVESGMTYRNEKFYWETFTAQGAQDLRFRLMVANNYRVYSGEIDASNTTPPFNPIDWVSRIRLTPTVGAQYNVISNGGASGFHDNFSPYWMDYYQLAYESDVVVVLVQNQSVSITHSFMYSVKGWAFKNKKETSAQIYTQNGKKYTKLPGIFCEE